MAGELEKFLQQAAERLSEKVNQKQTPPNRPVPAKQPPRNVRQAERRKPDMLGPEVVEAVVLTAPNPEDTDPLSTIDTRHLETYQRRELAQEISLADERMASHVRHVTDGDVMHLREASKALSGPPSTSDATQVKRRQLQVSPLVKMLRTPETLRAAFIASQIFERKCR